MMMMKLYLVVKFRMLMLRAQKVKVQSSSLNHPMRALLIKNNKNSLSITRCKLVV